jgi:carbamoyltransferase
LRDGYYVSACLTPPGLPYLLDTWLRHNTSVSLWHRSGRDVRVVAYWPLERYSGWRRHGAAVADEAAALDLVASLLASVDVDIAEVVEFWGTPGVGGDRYVDVSADFGGADLPPHSVAHVFSCALLDTDVAWSEPVLALAVDGGPDSDAVLATKEYASSFAGAYVESGSFTWFPIESPARLFTAARHRYGVREEPLMALASAARCDADLAELRAEALKELTFTGPAATLLVECERFVGRLHEAVVEAFAAGRCVPDERFSADEQLMSAVMKEIQRISQSVMERNVDAARERFGFEPAVTNLALAGGFALNAPANSALMSKYGFTRLLAPPCVDDSGQSLGIALGTFYQRCGSDFDFRFPGAYLGNRDDDLSGAVAMFEKFVAEVGAASVGQVVDDLRSGPVAWVDGRAELGPRALGHRSILADPTTVESKNELNRLKHREWWRPVTPIVREQDCADWFDGGRPSPYLLETFPIRRDQAHRVPAIADAQVQTLTRQQDSLLYDVLSAFADATGVPMVCTASLNDEDEPIVDDLPQAFDFCLRTGIPVAYVNGYRIAFRNAHLFEADGPCLRNSALFERTEGRTAELSRELNPAGLDELYLHVWLRYPLLRRRFDPADQKSAPALRRTVDAWLARDNDLRHLFAQWIHQSHNPRTRIGG